MKLLKIIILSGLFITLVDAMDSNEEKWHRRSASTGSIAVKKGSLANLQEKLDELDSLLEQGSDTKSDSKEISNATELEQQSSDHDSDNAIDYKDASQLAQNYFSPSTQRKVPPPAKPPKPGSQGEKYGGNKEGLRNKIQSIKESKVKMIISTKENSKAATLYDTQFPAWTKSIVVHPKGEGDFSKKNAGSCTYEKEDAEYVKKLRIAIMNFHKGTKKFNEMFSNKDFGLLEGGSTNNCYTGQDLQKEQFSIRINGKDQLIDNFRGDVEDYSAIEKIVLEQHLSSIPEAEKKTLNLQTQNEQTGQLSDSKTKVQQKIKKAPKSWSKKHKQFLFWGAISLTAANVFWNYSHWWKK